MVDGLKVSGCVRRDSCAFDFDRGSYLGAVQARRVLSKNLAFQIARSAYISFFVDPVTGSFNATGTVSPCSNLVDVAKKWRWRDRRRINRKDNRGLAGAFLPCTLLLFSPLFATFYLHAVGWLRKRDACGMVWD